MAHNNSEKNIYIQSATLNGKPWNKPWFSNATSPTAAGSCCRWARARTRIGAARRMPRLRRCRNLNRKTELYEESAGRNSCDSSQRWPGMQRCPWILAERIECIGGLSWFLICPLWQLAETAENRCVDQGSISGVWKCSMCKAIEPDSQDLRCYSQTNPLLCSGDVLEYLS